MRKINETNRLLEWRQKSESPGNSWVFPAYPSFSFSMQIKALCAFLSENDPLTAFSDAQELFSHSAETLLPLCRHRSFSLLLLELLLGATGGRSNSCLLWTQRKQTCGSVCRVYRYRRGWQRSGRKLPRQCISTDMVWKWPRGISMTASVKAVGGLDRDDTPNPGELPQASSSA